MQRLLDRVAMVTGAASGIGRAIALRLREEGALVFAVDRNRQMLDELPADGSGLRPHLADVTPAGAAAAVVRSCLDQFGRLDVLVNNAGFGNSKPALETSDQEFDAWIDGNLTNTFRLSRDAMPALRERRGTIVNITSVLGLIGVRQQAAYSAAKAGIIGLTRQMAAEYGPDGVRVNAIAPGLVETAATAGRLANDADYRAVNLGSTPLGRAGRPEDVAAAAAFLASDDASFICGQVLVVDGGMSATCTRR